jgi:hypothetical protein
VDQVSKPVLIALVAAIALVGVRFTILRPSSGSGSSPASATAPGQTGLQSAIDKANNAVGVSKQSATQHEQAAAAASGDSSAAAPGATAAKTQAAGSAAAKPAAAANTAKLLPKLDTGDRSGPILRDLASNKVVVALFYNPSGADDNAALHAVRAANRHNGRVVVHSIPIKDVGNYNALTTGVQVLESPTVLVIGPDHKARTIVGYTEVKEIDQTVGDVGGKSFQDRPAKHLTGFAARANALCQNNQFSVASAGTPTDVDSFEHTIATGRRSLLRTRNRIASVPAHGAKERAAKRALLAGSRGHLAALAKADASLKAGGAAGPAFLLLVSDVGAMVRKYQPALHAIHVRHCLG